MTAGSHLAVTADFLLTFAVRDSDITRETVRSSLPLQGLCPAPFKGRVSCTCPQATFSNLAEAVYLT